MGYGGLSPALTVHHSPALLYCLQGEARTVSLTSIKMSSLASLPRLLSPRHPLATVLCTPLFQLTPSGLVILVTEMLLK